MPGVPPLGLNIDRCLSALLTKIGYYKMMMMIIIIAFIFFNLPAEESSLKLSIGSEFGKSLLRFTLKSSEK